jgi:hypothetical protein
MVAGQDLRLLWFAIRHEKRPGWLLLGLAVLLLFAVESLNFSRANCALLMLTLIAFSFDFDQTR